MNTTKTNREGLTFIEWLGAAFLGVDGVREYARSHTSDQLRLQEAWEDGEDPTEYAAARQGKS